jgi:hypothetical protein
LHVEVVFVEEGGVDNPQIRLLFYAMAVSGACVEICGSIEVGVWHPSLYWAAIAAIIPCGLIGILRISQLYAPSPRDYQASDLENPIAPEVSFALVPPTVSDDRRFGPPLPPMRVNRRKLAPAKPRPGDGQQTVAERC